MIINICENVFFFRGESGSNLIRWVVRIFLAFIESIFCNIEPYTNVFNIVLNARQKILHRYINTNVNTKGHPWRMSDKKLLRKMILHK